MYFNIHHRWTHFLDRTNHGTRVSIQQVSVAWERSSRGRRLAFRAISKRRQEIDVRLEIHVVIDE
jgi:hypothetical protein